LGEGTQKTPAKKTTHNKPKKQKQQQKKKKNTKNPPKATAHTTHRGILKESCSQMRRGVGI